MRKREHEVSEQGVGGEKESAADSPLSGETDVTQSHNSKTMTQDEIKRGMPNRLSHTGTPGCSNFDTQARGEHKSMRKEKRQANFIQEHNEETLIIY